MIRSILLFFKQWVIKFPFFNLFLIDLEFQLTLSRTCPYKSSLLNTLTHIHTYNKNGRQETSKEDRQRRRQEVLEKEGLNVEERLAEKDDDKI
mgnify:CR=1 FL=1